MAHPDMCTYIHGPPDTTQCSAPGLPRIFHQPFAVMSNTRVEMDRGKSFPVHVAVLVVQILFVHFG